MVSLYFFVVWNIIYIKSDCGSLCFPLEYIIFASMRRMIHTIMCVVVLLFAVQPVLLLHYCQGSLANINYPVNGHSVGCSESKMVTVHHNMSINSESCCSNHMLKLSTDDYLQTASPTFNLPIVLVCSAIIFMALAIVATNSILSHLTYPPPNQRYTGLSMLQRLCVYRL